MRLQNHKGFAMHVKVEVDTICKQFGTKVILNNVCATTESGRCLAVSGTNGSGKSTLLKIIGGLIRPSSGQIRFAVNNAVSSEASRISSGMVSPEMSMYAMLSGVENIMFWTRVRGVKCSAAEAEELCCRVGLKGTGGELVAAYSTGMHQRLKLAVINAINPRVWLLDEPSSYLDQSGRQIVQSLIDSAVKRGAVVILATNDAGEAAYADAKITL